MKTRGWMLAMFVMLVMCARSERALAGQSTNAADFMGGQYKDAPLSISDQFIIAGDMADEMYGNKKDPRVRTAVVESSKGTFLPAANVIMFDDTRPPVAGSEGEKSREFLNNALTAATYGADDATNSKGYANSDQILSDLNVSNGVYSTASVNVGQMVVEGLGGLGGSIPNRNATIRNQWVKAAQSGCGDALVANMMNKNLANRIWVSPFRTKQEMSQKDGYVGYDYKAWGVSLGYDHAFAGGLTLGAAFTYSRGDYDEKNVRDDNTIDNYGVSAYAQYYNVCSGFFANIGGGFNYGDNDWKRRTYGDNAGWQRADNHTNSYWAGGSVGYDFRISNAFTLTPTVGLFWSESTTPSYRSRNSNGLVQNFGKLKGRSLMLPVELTAAYNHRIDDSSSISFEVKGGYSYNFKNDGARGSLTYGGWGGQTVLIQGVKPGRHGWNVGGGVKYRVKNFDIGVDYRYDGRSKYDAHRVSATVGLRF